MLPPIPKFMNNETSKKYAAVYNRYHEMQLAIAKFKIAEKQLCK